MNALAFEKVAILGVGLLGASFGLALKGVMPDCCITGYGRSESNLIYAKERGIIDKYSLDASEACSDADLILLAVPVGSFVELVKGIVSAFKNGAVVTDTGSVKGELVYRIQSILPEGVHFVGSHPIAGSHESGARYAKSSLFKDALCVITPTEQSHQFAVSQVTDLWKAFGCRVVYMDPHEHDRVYNLVSHFPHLLSYCVMHTVTKSEGNGVFSYAGRGFKDLTRIAASSPELWTDILILNRENLSDTIDRFIEELMTFKRWLSGDNYEEIQNYLKEANLLRRSIE